jgi:TDG/mug DNA glycosylase family protein
MLAAHALPDVLAPSLAVVFCGTAAGEKSAARGTYYAGPGNSFWTTLYAVGLTPRQLIPAEFRTLPSFGIGLTDIAKCRSGNDAALAACDFDVPAFGEKVRRFEPRAIGFNGKKAAAVFYGYRTGDLVYGLQAAQIGTTAVWVLPSTSAAARGSWSMEPWRAMARFANEHALS